jgi:hypothetical protein
MPNLLGMGQKEGTIVSAAFQVPVEWVGFLVYIRVDVPANENDAANSLTFTAEIGDSETGPWEPYGGFGWQGGGFGKDGTWSPGRAWVLSVSDVGRWVRATLVVPVRMRCGIDIGVRDTVI